MAKIALLIALALAGCTTAGGQFCQVAQPIYPTPEDVAAISDRLVSGLLTHNETGAKLCGWK